MSSSAEPLPAALVAERVRAALAGSRRAVVLVDGRSGSGKTTFAERIAAEAGARLLRLDDVYPGWDGLDAASSAVARGVLVPRLAGIAGRVRGWDWRTGRPTEGTVVPVDRPLVIEGCGALSRSAAALAELRVWVELDDGTRLRRALDRDGDTYAPHWARWARQEARFIAKEDPRRHADLVLDGRSVRPLPSPRTADAHYPRSS